MCTQELAGILLTNLMELQFSVTVKSEGIIVAKKTEAMSRNRILPLIQFDFPFVLEQGKNYDFYISSTLHNHPIRQINPYPNGTLIFVLLSVDQLNKPLSVLID